ncbi:hypothetical protein MXB_1470, partial [Myxobolus squamalis]
IILTSTDSDSSSYALYWDDAVGTFLGDQCITSIAENLERAYTKRESISDLYLVSKIETQDSKVCVFGNSLMLSQKIGDYVGDDDLEIGYSKFLSPPSKIVSKIVREAIDSSDSQLYSYRRLYDITNNTSYLTKYNITLQSKAHDLPILYQI